MNFLYEQFNLIATQFHWLRPAWLFALIPAFLPLLKKAKSSEKLKGKTSSPSIVPNESTVPVEPSLPLNNFGTALALTALALIVGVIEIVIFSVVANFFGVVVDAHTMPTNWQVVFFLLFLLPGLLLFRAMMSISNMFH